MTSVAPAAAPQPPIFHAEAARTPLQEAVASELGGELASAFLVLPSQLDGFVQVGEPREEHLVVNFGTAKKKSPTAVTVRTRPLGCGTYRLRISPTAPTSRTIRSLTRAY